MVHLLGFAENSIQLVPDGTMLLHVVIILVMVYVLNATLFRPINTILAAREKRTKGSLTEAQEVLAGVSEKVTEYERALRAARTQAYARTEQDRTNAMQDRQKELDAVRAELAATTASEKESIRNQAEAARADLNIEASRVAAEIGSRILSRPISGADLN
jgi:F-type H+-transporting ATPase subunit b